MEKFRIEIAEQSSDNQHCLLNVSGDLGVSNIGNIKNALLQHINKYRHIDIKVKDVLFIDLSFIQLLLSLEKTAEKEKREISASLSVNGEFKELILSTGFKLDFGNKNTEDNE